jgi:hypothetical protein
MAVCLFSLAIFGLTRILLDKFPSFSAGFSGILICFLFDSGKYLYFGRLQDQDGALSSQASNKARLFALKSDLKSF